MMLSRIFVFFSLLVLISQTALAQSSSPSFEVASIKSSDPNVRNVSIRNMPGGGLNISGATLKLLIQQAYDVRDFQISGGPGWIDSDRYDIVAKAESGQSPDLDRRQAMELQRARLRALLDDRFRLKIRRETKEHQVYALLQAKGGPKLRESTHENPGPPLNGDKNPQRRGGGMRVSPGHIVGQSASLDFLVQVLSQFVGRTVIDKTGLKGTYDFTLEWSPDMLQGQGFGLGTGAPGEQPKEPPRADSPAPAESGGPSLFTALQEQLGLKLESQKGPVETIVIESVEKPSEN